MAYTEELQTFLHFVKLCEKLTNPNSKIYNPITHKEIKYGSKIYKKLISDGILENYNYEDDYITCLNYNCFKNLFLLDDVINCDVVDREHHFKEYLVAYNINTYKDALDVLKEQENNILKKIKESNKTICFYIGSCVKLQEILLNPIDGKPYYKIKNNDREFVLPFALITNEDYILCVLDSVLNECKKVNPFFNYLYIDYGSID